MSKQEDKPARPEDELDKMRKARSALRQIRLEMESSMGSNIVNLRIKEPGAQVADTANDNAAVEDKDEAMPAQQREIKDIVVDNLY